MKQLYDNVSFELSSQITKRYSTSFSMAMTLLPPKIRKAIYAIYGYVRVADEIVDTFEGYDQAVLLSEFKDQTFQAIDRGISTNPVLHCFQDVVNEYNIDHAHIDAFLYSMETDLDKSIHNKSSYDTYIYGSAEVVGLMCLHVFLDGNQAEYERLKPFAQKLGSAFQKINFLRDLGHDVNELDRVYFPGFNPNDLSKENFQKIYDDIQHDFDQGLEGIKGLPKSVRCAVYTAYKYYLRLFKKIKTMNTIKAFEARIRINNLIKLRILFSSYLRHKINFI